MPQAWGEEPRASLEQRREVTGNPWGQEEGCWDWGRDQGVLSQGRSWLPRFHRPNNLPLAHHGPHHGPLPSWILALAPLKSSICETLVSGASPVKTAGRTPFPGHPDLSPGDRLVSREAALLLCFSCHLVLDPQNPGSGPGPTVVSEAKSRSAGLPGSTALTPGSEVAQDADVGKVHPVAMGIQAEQKGPLEGDEAPDAGEVVAVGVYEALVSGDGQCEEGAEGGDGDHREEDAHEEEATQALEPGPPIIL